MDAICFGCVNRLFPKSDKKNVLIYDKITYLLKEKAGDTMKKRSFVLTIIFAAVAVLYTAAVKLVDQGAIAPDGSDVGFSTFNYMVHWKVGVDMRWYGITELIGYIAILVMASFALMGLVQLVQRKSIKSVDRSITMMGVTYVVMAVCYALFEFIVINYRPVIMPGEAELEASFPSSHTMLVCVVFGAGMIAWWRLFSKKPALRILLAVVSVLMMILMIAGRLLSGCHWATDIIGGVLYATAIVALYRDLSKSVR